MQLALTKEQIEVVSSTARYISNIAGRRVGKTIGVCRGRILKRCLGKRGVRYTYIVPQYSQLWEEYDTLIRMEELTPKIVRRRTQPYPHIYWDTSSITSYRSFDRPENIRSKGEDEVWADEIQDYGETEFWAVIRPLVSDRRGTIGVSGQLRGRNWVWRSMVMPGLLCRSIIAHRKRLPNDDVVRWCNDACYDGAPVVNVADVEDAASKIDASHPEEYAAWVTPSHHGLMFQGAAGMREIEVAKRQMLRSIYEQEYLCIPTAGISGVFRPDDLEAAKRSVSRGSPDNACKYILSVDLGRVVDPCSVVIYEIQTDTVVYEEVFPLKQDHAISAARVRDLRVRWNDASVVVDTTGGATGGHAEKDAYVELYREANPFARPIFWNYQTKKSMIEELVLAFEQRKIACPAALRETHRQLAAYTYTAKSDNKIDYHAPAGEHDDLVAALAMAWLAKRRGWYGQQTIGGNFNVNV